jgi:hypothetical protein
VYQRHEVGNMELDSGDGSHRTEEQMLESLAQALLAEHGPKALQRLVDDIQQALRLGDDTKAAHCERVLVRIEEILRRP